MTVLHRPASPLFVPKKHGVDKETQVEGDLFDFDFEVRRRCVLLQPLFGNVLVIFHVRWSLFLRLWSGKRLSRR